MIAIPYWKLFKFNQKYEFMIEVGEISLFQSLKFGLVEFIYFVVSSVKILEMKSFRLFSEKFLVCFRKVDPIIDNVIPGTHDLIYEQIG